MLQILPQAAQLMICGVDTQCLWLAGRLAGFGLLDLADERSLGDTQIRATSVTVRPLRTSATALSLNS
jgi:hypothetical protein